MDSYTSWRSDVMMQVRNLELPSYIVRRSKRAKRVQLSITPAEGLVVVIPDRYSADRIPAIVTERRAWIEQTLEQMADDRAFFEQRNSEPLLPETIELRALGERRTVIYRQSSSGRVHAREQGPYRLVLSGGFDDQRAQRALRRWLVRRTRSDIVPWLNELAESRSLGVTGVSIRNQRTRWASCSVDGKMSINQNLLFLPRRLVRLVLLHELCHLIEMNHSARFWQLVEQEEPDLVALDEELDGAWKLIPRWAHT